MSIANFLISTGKVYSINRKLDSWLQSVKRDRYLLFRYFILVNAASHICVLPKRTRIFLAIARRLKYAIADFHASIKSVHSLNLFSRRTSFLVPIIAFEIPAGRSQFRCNEGLKSIVIVLLIAWNCPNRSSTCFKIGSKTAANVVVGTSL